MYIDSHCHLNMLVKHEKSPISMTELVAQAELNSIDKMLCVAVNTTDWAEMKSMCAPYPDKIVLSAGIHPCYMHDQDFICLSKQANDTQVVAIGETGLDYYYCDDRAVKQQQQVSFAKHIALSAELQKPLIIHTREARKDTIAIMRSEQAQIASGVMHCFTETLEMAKQALDLGFYISFSGIVTFKNARQIREVCDYVPLDRVLIETDSPYLAPTPYRGKINRPDYVKYIAETVADIKNMTTAELAQITTDNFYQLFKKAV